MKNCEIRHFLLPNVTRKIQSNYLFTDLISAYWNQKHSGKVQGHEWRVGGVCHYNFSKWNEVHLLYVFRLQTMNTKIRWLRWERRVLREGLLRAERGFTEKASCLQKTLKITRLSLTDLWLQYIASKHPILDLFRPHTHMHNK